MSCRHCNECGGARASVQIFVGTADREIDGVAIEPDFHHTCGMTEIPDHERASVVKTSGNGSDVEQRTGPVVDMRQHGDCNLAIDQGVYRSTVATDQSSPHRLAG